VKRVRLAPQALAELEDAAVWYESREHGVGRQFVREVERLLPRLRARPRSFPRLLDTAPELEVRRALLPRFPFALVFMELSKEIRVLAVAHMKRKPGYWLHRLRH